MYQDVFTINSRGIHGLVSTFVRLKTSYNRLIRNLNGITRVKGLQFKFAPESYTMLEGQAETLDVEPTHTCMNQFDAAIMLCTLQIGQFGISQFPVIPNGCVLAVDNTISTNGYVLGCRANLINVDGLTH